jgi:putative hydrolase of the HAD superfamily
VLKEAGIETSEKLVLSMLGKMQQFKMKLVLFDDVAPVLTELKGKGLTLGLISNVEKDMSATLEKLGLTSWLDIVVTSQDSGFSKPQPEIFREALVRAALQPSEAIYVGDQYQVDVIGSNATGLKGILIDRGSYFEEITDCPRLKSLTELVEYL